MELKRVKIPSIPRVTWSHKSFNIIPLKQNARLYKMMMKIKFSKILKMKKENFKLRKIRKKINSQLQSRRDKKQKVQSQVHSNPKNEFSLSSQKVYHRNLIDKLNKKKLKQTTAKEFK
jgi:hypothetical protein